MDLWCKNLLARDLRSFHNVIEKYDESYCFDRTKLLSIADEVENSSKFNIESNEFTFRIFTKIAKSSPPVSKLEILLESSIHIHEDINLNTHDPIDECKFHLKLTGFDEVNCVGPFVNCWRIDKDIDSDGEQKYTHPRYHFQLGGHQMDEIDTGGVLLTAAPRIPHPPMDLFLAIHFIFNNFFNLNDDSYFFIKSIIVDDVYREIIERAKNRMWTPYFKGLQSVVGNQELNLKTLFPLATFD